MIWISLPSPDLLTGGVVLESVELLEARDDGEGVDSGGRPATHGVCNGERKSSDVIHSSVIRAHQFSFFAAAANPIFPSLLST